MENNNYFKKDKTSEAVEWITCSALEYNGQIFTGINHGECYEKLIHLHPSLVSTSFDYKNGFLTNKHRFVSREEASIIAEQAKQMQTSVKDETPGQLYSEHLKRSE